MTRDAFLSFGVACTKYKKEKSTLFTTKKKLYPVLENIMIYFSGFNGVFNYPHD
jgi:hypothetical protein